MANLAPLSSLRVSRHQIPAWNHFPNTSVQRKPLLIYHSVFKTPVSPSSVEAHLRKTGVVTPQWRFTMYDFSHYHSTSHEVLCIVHGRARLCFGGEGNPDRVEPVVSQGDVLIVPAGVAHRLLEDMDGGFQMVGSYPGEASWDMCHGRSGEEEQRQRIKTVAWLHKDPIYGDAGPVLDL